MSDIDQARWDALQPADALPFLDWAFLDTLEESGTAAPSRGWTPRHFTVWRGADLIGAMPGYLKTHSMGEYMYNDFQWASVTPRFGVRYYPKLILAVPFGPAPGPRPLVAAGEDRRSVALVLFRAAQDFARTEKYSSVHVLFSRDEDLPLLAEAGFAQGAGQQFHWKNRSYRSFDDFLGRFNSKRRHMLKSERNQLSRDGTVVRTVRGEELVPRVTTFAGRCYEATVEKHAWNPALLTPAFFALAGERLRHIAEVVLAEEGGRPLGAAFNLLGARRLYGRHWGAVEDRRFLHFNVCYYHSIERCITDGLEAFEPGAGGEHKVARGFEPTVMHSGHWFVNQGLHAAMTDYLARVTIAYEQHVAEAREAEVAFKGGLASAES
jgi:predicted N-acyltransferase